MTTTTTTTTHTCSVCGETKSHTGIGTGYGVNKSGAKVCYECCGARDRADMVETGRATLYLTTTAETSTYGRAKVSNWPGSLEFYGRYSVGRHNTARKRYDVAFIGPDGFWWSGTQFGDNTQICRCKRTKRKAA